MNFFHIILILTNFLFFIDCDGINNCLNGLDCEFENEGIYCSTNVRLTNSINMFIADSLMSTNQIKNDNFNFQLACFPFYNKEQGNESCWTLMNPGKEMDKNNQFKFLMNLIHQYLPDKSDLDFFDDFLPQSTCYTFKQTTCRKTYIGSTTIKTSIKDQVINSSFKSTFLMDKFYQINTAEFGLTNMLIWCDFNIYAAMTLSCLKDLQNNSNNFIHTDDQILIRNDSVFSKCLPTRPQFLITAPFYPIYNIGYGISCFFLFLHIMTAMIFKELRQYPRNITLGISIALLFNEIMSLLVLQVKGTLVGCFILYGTFRFSQLVLYLWFNVLAFDAWKTFCHTNQQNGTSKGLKRYLIYTFSCALCIVSCDIVLMIFTDKKHILHYRFFHNFCYIGRQSNVYVFYLPIMLIILLINSIFFFMISNRILHSQMSPIIQFSSRVTKYHIYWKLGLLVGVPWIFDVIANILTEKFQTASDVIQYIALVFIIPQGPTLFYLFGLTPKFKEKMYHYVSKCCKQGNESTNQQINSSLKLSTTTLESVMAT